MRKELIELLHECQNRLLAIKQILEEMDIWEEVYNKSKKYNRGVIPQ